jgi:hypothetical protein
MSSSLLQLTGGMTGIWGGWGLGNCIPGGGGGKCWTCSDGDTIDVIEFAEADMTDGSLQTEEGEATSAMAAAAAAAAVTLLVQ